MQSATAPIARLFTFVAGTAGPWLVDRVDCIAGEPLPSASRLSVIAGPLPLLPVGASWALRGITSNERYVVRTVYFVVDESFDESEFKGLWSKDYKALPGLVGGHQL